MQRYDILDVENISDAIAVSPLLQHYGYQIVSAQVELLRRPVQREVKLCDDCRLVTPNRPHRFPGHFKQNENAESCGPM